jgi:hypothetical protein
VLVTERFVGLAEATYESRRLPGGPMIVMPPTEETEYSDPATMARISDEAFARFLETMVASKAAAARAGR